MNPLLIFTLIGGAALLFRNANRANITANTAQVRLTGIRINTKNFLSPYFELTFNIWNTVNSNLDLQAISGNVYYQGNPVASLQYAGSQRIIKGNNFITVRANPNGLEIMQTLIKAIGGKFTRDLTVRGTAIISGIAVPIEMSI